MREPKYGPSPADLGLHILEASENHGDPPPSEGEITRLARRGYEAYGDAAEWKNYQGSKMPAWEDLPEHIRTYWGAAVRAIRA